MEDTILTIQQLSIYHRKAKDQPLVRPLDLAIPKGKTIGIIGESGSGKSLTMKALMGILPKQLTAEYTSYYYNGQQVTQTQHLPMAMIFQDPMTALNPLRTIGYHLFEVIRRREKNITKQALLTESIAALEKVGISYPAERLKNYPHELSGGMRQRIMIAMALLTKPKILIADEPTTALDVTIQFQILQLINQLQKTEGLTVLLVTHDFGVVAGMCDEVKVMYQGEIIEQGDTEQIFYHPQHAYTQKLLQAADLQHLTI
ncbi:ABC transporter ATP-binding protein [Enterococcus columbae]|uniref:ABC transporter domain-containing protein n=1 Tax=Enterococcus columbae DSM 7374 = ATCC 51263 TaxID=1121865 RepID=S0K529_9ENTE|nr:ABC transporter ATP-binding protein [Enterococcus columbae]EOT39637.1 hypothetical protein OMW_01834 [Enterococcus columbae DSM 7374 = ATCC 51263]EOW84030.1 hypothetical protein I568_01477 [Enterococcus columbae DSM 7374 = ATCC 51263]